ncbi:MAG: hypothetical protein Q8P20_01115 [bacterium]|nr:hypothetical protein [bacterium]
MARKIGFKSSGNVLDILIADQTIVCDIDSLPESVKQKAIIFGVKRKIGNSIIGCEESEAMIESVNACIESLQSGAWVEKAAKAPTLTKAKIQQALGTLSEAEREALLPLLAKMGL